jgi:hypothetical protein
MDDRGLLGLLLIAAVRRGRAWLERQTVLSELERLDDRTRSISASIVAISTPSSPAPTGASPMPRRRTVRTRHRACSSGRIIERPGDAARAAAHRRARHHDRGALLHAPPDVVLAVPPVDFAGFRDRFFTALPCLGGDPVACLAVATP